MTSEIRRRESCWPADNDGMSPSPLWLAAEGSNWWHHILYPTPHWPLFIRIKFSNVDIIKNNGLSYLFKLGSGLSHDDRNSLLFVFIFLFPFGKRKWLYTLKLKACGLLSWNLAAGGQVAFLFSFFLEGTHVNSTHFHCKTIAEVRNVKVLFYL